MTLTFQNQRGKGCVDEVKVKINRYKQIKQDWGGGRGGGGGRGRGGGGGGRGGRGGGGGK